MNANSQKRLISHDIPDRPWAKVGCDLFTFDDNNYVVTVDCYSNFWEIDYLQNTKASTVIQKLRAQFARHGIPDTVISDNGPQFTSEEFVKFSKTWEFEHITSSPGYPQSNGKAELAVKSAKHLMKKAKKSECDPYLALLDFRNTPSQHLGSSPVQRLMNRRTKTLLPTKGSLLKPCIENGDSVTKRLKGAKDRQAHYYNQGAKELPPLNQGDTVRLSPSPGFGKDAWTKGVVNKQVNIRSYDVTTDDGRSFRRNRRHLRLSKENSSVVNQENECDSSETPDIIPVVLQNSTSR